MALLTHDDWRSGRHVVSRVHAHIVLVPKYRKKVMTDRVSAELKAAFEDVCQRFGAEIEAFETDDDHTHLLVSYPPKVALSRLVMSLKTNSSRWVRERHWIEIERALWGEHFWSPSYAVVSRRSAAGNSETIRGEPKIGSSDVSVGDEIARARVVTD